MSGLEKKGCMSAKSLVYLGMFIGSIIGGYIPTLFGVGLISFTSVLCSGIGSILGIWVGYKLSEIM